MVYKSNILYYIHNIQICSVINGKQYLNNLNLVKMDTIKN